MRLNARFLAIFAFVLGVAGCGQTTNTAQLEQKVTELESHLKTTQGQVDTLTTEVATLQMQMALDRMAFLTPGSTGYGTVKMELGYLTVSLADVAPYANGTKATLRIGNLTNATISGLKATLDWGAVDKDGKPNNREAKSREESIVESLPPGAWSRVNVILDGVPPASLGFVRVRDVSHTAIQLRSR